MIKKILVIFIVVFFVVVAVAVLLTRGFNNSVNGVLVDENTAETIGDVDGTPVKIDNVVVDKSGDLVYVLPNKDTKVSDGQPVVWIE